MKETNTLERIFSTAETKTLLALIDQINNLLKGKVRNISAEERRKYGSIGDGNTLFVDKCYTYMQSKSDTIPPSLDKKKFETAYLDRKIFRQALDELKMIAEKMEDTKILLDYANYNDCLSYYRYVRFLSQENHPGINTIHDNLKKHFARGKNQNEKNTPEDNTENSTTV